MKHFVVAHDFDPTPTELETVFDIDPEIGEELVITEHTDLASLAVEANVFPSKGQARKNGLFGPIPHGLNMFGTKKRRFWVWAPVGAPAESVVVKPGFIHSNRWFNATNGDFRWLPPKSLSKPTASHSTPATMAPLTTKSKGTINSLLTARARLLAAGFSILLIGAWQTLVRLLVLGRSALISQEHKP